MKKTISLALALTSLLVGVWTLAPRATDAAPQWQSFAPSLWMLGPMQAADGNEKTVLTNLDMISRWDIPITTFHFDAPDWMECTGNAQFGYSDTVLNRMRQRGVRGLFWLVPLIGIHCAEYSTALAYDYFVKDANGQVIVTDNFTGHGSWIDFNNPDAVAFWHSLLDGLRARTTGVIGGFYTDSVRPDDVTGQVAYGEAYALDLLNYTRANIPDGDVIFKRYGKNTPSDAWLSQYAHAAYVNDLPTNWYGLEEGIRRVFDTSALMPLAYNELSGFNRTPPTADTYIRRMHWGAFQPLMENLPKTAQPWDPRYPPEVMEAYRYYANLHWELQPYLHSYDQAAFEDHAPIFRDTNASQYSARLGNEFFVKYVTRDTDRLRVSLPPGRWINYWDEKQTFAGGATISYQTPPGREPIFIAQGAIIPMQVRNPITGHGTRKSAGALTVNVYPGGHSTFRYHDLALGWLTLQADQAETRLAFCTPDGAPGQPLIWRIAQVRKKPVSVTTEGGAVGVNTAWGTRLVERASELAVGKSANGWYYDAAARRVIVKLSMPGTACPAP